MSDEIDTVALSFDDLLGELLRLNHCEVCASCGPLRATGRLALLELGGDSGRLGAHRGRFTFTVGDWASFSVDPTDFDQGRLETDHSEDEAVSLLSVRRASGELLVIWELPL